MSEAIRIYSTAKGYVQSTYLIVTSPHRFQVPDDTSFFLSVHMLLGFAVELYLKSYSTHVGYSGKELRSSGVRHNLERLLELSEAKGFNLPAAKQLVDYLGEHHGSFEYRYITPNSSYVIRPQASVFIELHALDTYVDRKIGASASKGLDLRYDGWTIPDEMNCWRI